MSDDECCLGDQVHIFLGAEEPDAPCVDMVQDDSVYSRLPRPCTLQFDAFACRSGMGDKLMEYPIDSCQSAVAEVRTYLMPGAIFMAEEESAAQLPQDRAHRRGWYRRSVRWVDPRDERKYFFITTEHGWVPQCASDICHAPLEPVVSCCPSVPAVPLESVAWCLDLWAQVNTTPAPPAQHQ